MGKKTETLTLVPGTDKPNSITRYEGPGGNWRLLQLHNSNPNQDGWKPWNLIFLNIPRTMPAFRNKNTPSGKRKGSTVAQIVYRNQATNEFRATRTSNQFVILHDGDNSVTVTSVKGSTRRRLNVADRESDSARDCAAHRRVLKQVRGY